MLCRKGILNFEHVLAGYSLIELLVVISIFGITVSLVTASYLTFERNQRFKNSALQIKSDIRYAQSKASAGDKSSAGCTNSSDVLLGWYLNFSTSNPNSYSIFSDCLRGGSEGTTLLNNKSQSVPLGVTICKITAGGSDRNNINILFQPLTAVGTFHIAPTTPGFLDANGAFKAQISGAIPNIAEIYLSNVSAACNTSGTYKVVVQSNGEVNEVKIP